MTNQFRARSALALTALFSSLLVPLAARGDDSAFATDIAAIAQAWDHANFAIASAHEKRSALEELSKRTSAFAQAHPGRAEPLIWEGIVLSSYAGARGGFGALGIAKQSREKLNAALEIDPRALNGSAYTSLGALYYKVPGFPIGFGNHDKAREYLRKALEINPNGIDPNFFNGELMFEEGKYAQALQYLQKAQAAAPRPERPIADDGRRKEIAELMQRTQAKLG